MPPKVKFTKDEIIDAALDMTREFGIEAVTARSLGSRLGVSSRPVFTAFDSMDEVRTEVIRKARKLFAGYVGDYAEYRPAFKRYGTQVLAFAQNEPKLFQLLFMREESCGQSYSAAIADMMGQPEEIHRDLQREHGLSEKEAIRLYDQMWVHVYGMSVLCARNVCRFTDEDISKMISEVFLGMLTIIKAGKINGYDVPVTKVF